METRDLCPGKSYTLPLARNPERRRVEIENWPLACCTMVGANIVPQCHFRQASRKSHVSPVSDAWAVFGNAH